MLSHEECSARSGRNGTDSLSVSVCACGDDWCAAAARRLALSPLASLLSLALTSRAPLSRLAQEELLQLVGRSKQEGGGLPVPGDQLLDGSHFTGVQSVVLQLRLRVGVRVLQRLLLLSWSCACGCCCGG